MVSGGRAATGGWLSAASANTSFGEVPLSTLLNNGSRHLALCFGSDGLSSKDARDVLISGSMGEEVEYRLGVIARSTSSRFHSLSNVGDSGN